VNGWVSKQKIRLSKAKHGKFAGKELHQALLIVVVEGSKHVPLDNCKEENEVAYQALPQHGLRRRCVVCSAIRTTGSNSAFSSKSGRSFFTFCLAA
jgi:hypothetical protein